MKLTDILTKRNVEKFGIQNTVGPRAGDEVMKVLQREIASMKAKYAGDPQASNALEILFQEAAQFSLANWLANCTMTGYKPGDQYIYFTPEMIETRGKSYRQPELPLLRLDTKTGEIIFWAWTGPRGDKAHVGYKDIVDLPTNQGGALQAGADLLR